MAWLNYHHLYYFWTVARTGSISAASQELHVSQPTISTQIKELEQSLGHAVFQRQGRGLALTELGRVAFRYADEIFRLGRDMQLALEGKRQGERVRFTVGIAQVIPKLIAERLLQPAFDAVPDLTIVCREGATRDLLGALALHEVDVVISDAPITNELNVRAYNHLLGETAVDFFAAPGLAHLKNGFPGSLDGAPVLLPSRGAQVRRQIDDWFDALSIHPVVVGEFDDSALLKVMGASTRGVFPAPSAIADLVEAQYGVKRIGRTQGVFERFYAISVERKIRHPAVAAIADAARATLFANR